MTKRLLGVLAALSMVSGTVVACSSSSDPTPATGTDAGKDAVATDSKTDTKTPTPTDGSADTGPTAEKTTGLACMSDDDCDKGLGINRCTEGAFGGDSLYPTSVCIGIECDPGDGSKIMGCDGDTGVCLTTASGGICLPVCEFDDSSTAPKGCIGKNACNVYGWGKDTMTMKTIGIGYCFGGCKADADCPTGNKCQTEDGLCVKTVTAYTKTPGTACTDADAKDPAKCNCLYTTAEKAGYCANVCRFGETTCGAGFSCDSGLPKTKLQDDDTVFTAVPTGMAGYCLKNCTTDADCAGLNAHCDENAGMAGQKTCNVGPRRCAKNEQCPTGQTCMGATATALGKCG